MNPSIRKKQSRKISQNYKVISVMLKFVLKLYKQIALYNMCLYSLPKKLRKMFWYALHFGVMALALYNFSF